MTKGKKYQDSAKLVDKTKLYDSEEAMALICQTAKAKFDEAVSKGAEMQTAINDFHKNFGVDIQVTLKMTNAKGEVVSSHVWKRQ